METNSSIYEVENDEENYYKKQGHEITYSDRPILRRINSLLPENNAELHQPPYVVIIGGGPVGLWTAIKIKKLFPQHRIRIYERYEEYKRSNLIKIPAISEMDLEKHSPLKKIWASGSETIQIQELEKILVTEAKNLEIDIVFTLIHNMEMLYEALPEVKFWIPADGAHSKIRETWYKQPPIENVLFNIVQVSYKTKNAAEDLSLWRKYPY